MFDGSIIEEHLSSADSMFTAPCSPPRGNSECMNGRGNKRHACCFDEIARKGEMVGQGADGCATTWEQDMKTSLDKIQQQIKELDDRALARRMSEDMAMASTAKPGQRDSNPKSRAQSEQMPLTPPYSPIAKASAMVGERNDGDPSVFACGDGLWDIIMQFPNPPPLLDVPPYSTLSISPMLGSQVPGGRSGVLLGFEDGMPTPPLTPLIGSAAGRRKSLELEGIGQFSLWQGDVEREIGQCKRRPLMPNAGKVREEARLGRIAVQGKENTQARRT